MISTNISPMKAVFQRLHGLIIRGQKRDDLHEKIRIAAIDINAAVAFEVDEDRQRVTIFNIFYGGRDYEAIMRDCEEI